MISGSWSNEDSQAAIVEGWDIFQRNGSWLVGRSDGRYLISDDATYGWRNIWEGAAIVGADSIHKRAFELLREHNPLEFEAMCKMCKTCAAYA